MEQVYQQPPGGQQSFPQTNQQEKQLIAILGVQGLSYQNYSVVELKIVLQIIRHAQKAILGYVIPYRLTSQTFNGFTVEQRAAGHTDVIMKLSEFPYGAHHYPQLRDAIKRIESHPIQLPFKQGDQTYYRKFSCLFKSEIYQDRHKNWMVNFRFDNNVIRFFYNYDKGVSYIDLNAAMPTDGHVGSLDLFCPEERIWKDNVKDLLDKADNQGEKAYKAMLLTFMNEEATWVNRLGFLHQAYRRSC